MLRIRIVLPIVLLAGASAASSVYAAQSSPRDVAQLSYERVPVQELIERGALSLSKQGRFYPSRLLSRGEAAAMAMNLRNRKADVGTSTQTFIDVDSDNKFFAAVEALEREGLLNGLTASRRFFPYKPIRSGEFIHLIAQALELNPTVNLDQTALEIDTTATGAARFIFAIDNNLMPAGEDAPLRQKGYLSRRDAAQIAWRMLKYSRGAEFGKASWYGDGLSKIKPENGLQLWEKKFTAAHKTLPIGTTVRVTNVWRGTSTEVVINDRGPFVEGRIVDLSRSAFSAIAPSEVGVMEVMIEVMSDT